MKILVIILIVTEIILIGILILYYEKKINRLKQNVLNSKTTAILNETLKLASKNETIRETSKKIELTIRKYFKVDYCSLFVYKENELYLISSNIDNKYNPVLEQYANVTLKDLEYEARIKTSKTSLSYSSARERNIKYSYFIPLKNEKEILGAILLENTLKDGIQKDTEEFFNILIKNITLVFQNMSFKEQLQKDNITDPLTKVYNRRYMTEILDRAFKGNKPFTIAMFDIDHFKAFNDTYGHEFGDNVLLETTKLIKNNIKHKDMLFRYGGEEFVIYFEDTRVDEVFNFIDNIREILSQHKIENSKGITANVTASFGVIEKNEAASVKNIIECADQALYYSKENGRNKITKYKDIKEKKL